MAYQPTNIPVNLTNLAKTFSDLATWPEQLTISRRIWKSGNGSL
jgi:hypothetical protein